MNRREIEMVSREPADHPNHFLVKHPETDRSFDLFHFLNKFFCIIFGNIYDHVADMLVGFEVLAGDIDIVFGKNLVQLRQHTRYVRVDVQQAVRVFELRQARRVSGNGVLLLFTNPYPA